MDDRIHEPAIDIEAIRWEPINLVIEGRVADRTARDAFDPASLRLVHAERDRDLPPTHASIVDGCLTLRINVMQGPDRVIDELILGEAG